MVAKFPSLHQRTTRYSIGNFKPGASVEYFRLFLESLNFELKPQVHWGPSYSTHEQIRAAATLNIRKIRYP